MTLYVADIASYQQGLVPAQLRPDVSALIVKCSQGMTYLDPDYAAWLGEARASGLLVGVYHYVDGSSPVAQAAWLRARIIDPSLIVMLDEEAVGLPQTLEVADAMTELGLHVRLVYLARSYWSAVGSPDLSAPFSRRGIGLVNAAYPSARAATPVQLYPGDGAAGWTPYGGVTPALWQFTESATEAGQRIDVSAFRGSMAQLTDLFTTTPAPHPAPAATMEDDDMQQIEPVSVHPGLYTYPTVNKAHFRLTVGDGGTADVRVVAWDAAGNDLVLCGDKGDGAVKRGARDFAIDAAHVSHVTVQRKDAGTFPVGVVAF